MKGQWFIISAVIASSAFLGLSFLLKDYYVTDSSRTARINNDFYLTSIESQLGNIVSRSVVDGNCINLTTSLDELKTLAGKELAAKGVLFSMNYTIRDCSQKKVGFNLLLASQDEIVYNFSTAKSPSEVIG